MKRLLISIPSGHNGVYDQQLVWWLIGCQVQSVIREFGDGIADEMSDLAQRIVIREAAEKFGIGWAAEQAELQWRDSEKMKHLWAPMIPKGWTVSINPVIGSPLAANRNQQARQFLYSKHYGDHAEDVRLEPTDFDAVLFIDTDNVPGHLDLHHLCEALDRDDVDMVGGVYCLEHPNGPQPIVYRILWHEQGFFYDRETLMKPPGLHRLEGGGLPTGCLAIKRHVFEKMWEARRPWFKDRLHDASMEHHELAGLLQDHKDDKAALYDALKTEMDKRSAADWPVNAVGSHHIGEDIWFCRMAYEMGFSMWVDTRVFWGHIKKADNKDTFRRLEAAGGRMFTVGAQAVDPTLTDEDARDLYRKSMRNRAKEVHTEYALEDKA